MPTALIIARLLCAGDDLEAVDRVATEERPVSVQAGVNLGLFVLDVSTRSLYGFVSSAVGTALMTKGSAAIGILGIGYTFVLSPRGDTMWVFDLFGEVSGGNLDLQNNGAPGPPSHALTRALVGALGVGLGFRWLHHSGFVIAFKLPLFGSAVATAQSIDVPAAIGYFYLANLISLPAVSFGYRF